MAIWDAIKELERLQKKAAKGKEICDSDTFIVRAALKEKGWEGLVCEEAISRGYREARGEKVTTIPSWYVEEAINRFEEQDASDDILSPSPEVQGDEAAEEEQEAPGRVFNLLGDMGGEESQEQEEVREEGSKDPLMYKDPETPKEHVNFLNRIHTMRTASPEWEDFLWTYMKKHKLRPTDMEGLVGPRPWKNDPLWYDPDEEEISTPPFPGSVDDFGLEEFRKIFGPIQKEETMEKETKLEEKVSGTRQRVFVGDEIGWICKPCNRVWGLDEMTCPSCDGEPGYEELYPAAKQAADKAIAKALGKKKSDKDLAIEAMHKALGYDVLGLTMTIEETEEDTVQCDHCGGNDYLECDCCLECEAETCVCCDNCARFPCQCDKEECPICHAQIPIAESCPYGCDSDIRELEQLYENVKNNKDLSFNEKIKFMSLLKEKMGLASDVADPNDPVATAEYLDDPETMEEE